MSEIIVKGNAMKNIDLKKKVRRILNNLEIALKPLRSPRTDWLIFPRQLLPLIHEQEHLRKILPYLDIDCVFDIGAHEGQYATMLRKEIGFKGRIISYEPNPEAAKNLIDLAKSDPLWEVREIALGSKVGEREFNVMEGSQFSSLSIPRHDDTQLFVSNNRVSRTVSVRVETLENVYNEALSNFGFKRPFLKMDTQGYDAMIFKSGRDTVSHFCGLQSELSIKKLYKDSIEFTEAINLYESSGFQLSALVSNNLGHFPDLIEMDCIMYRPR